MTAQHSSVVLTVRFNEVLKLFNENLDMVPARLTYERHRLTRAMHVVD
jgi:hypothetical protein